MQQRVRELFGPVEFLQNYGMTELVPFGASVCDQGHLHYEPAVGLLEVLDLETRRRPVGPGEPGAVVATPLPPFRETTVLLRYDTEDVVRTIEGPVDCSLRRVPATTNLLGKARLSVRHDDGWTFVRDVLDALESVEQVGCRPGTASGRCPVASPWRSSAASRPELAPGRRSATR